MMKTLIFVLGIFLCLPNVLAQETEAFEDPADPYTESTVPAETEASEEIGADDVPDDVNTSQSGKGVEKIEVTGSHIKRIDVEGPSPVLTLDREYLEKSGHNSAADVIRETSTSVFGGLRETALNGGAATGAATATIRGSDSTDVLVLMDGKRMTAIGGGQEIDLNLIPTESLERVEILKDGASAIYGSDALGGVINFITRKDYDGATVKFRYTHPEDGAGARRDFSAVYGKNFTDGNFLSVFQYRGNDEITSLQKDWAIATPDFYSPTSDVPAWKDQSDSSYNAPGCANPFPAGHPNEGRCPFDYSVYSWVVPRIEQYSALLSGNYELNANLNLFARVNATQRNVTSQLAPAPGALAVPQATATGQWGLPATEDILFVYRTVAEGGPRVNEVDSTGLNAVTGVSGYLGDTWEWEFSVNYSSSDTRNTQANGYFNSQGILDLANSGEFNPFDNTPDDLSSVALEGYREIFSDIFGVQSKFTGELFQLGFGPVNAAVGVNSNWISYEESGDPVTLAGNNWGGIAAQGQASRTFQAMFLELASIPWESLEVQLAGRVDRFNDFGTVFNPKFALRYKPVDSLILRASWGTGFKAPSLDDLYGGGGTAFPFARDELRCQNQGNGDPNDPACAVGQFLTQYTSNPDIKEEKSQSLNVGSVWQPGRDLSFAADFFRNQKDNIAGIASARDILRAEARPDLGLPYLQSLGFDVQRSGGQIDQIIAPSTNIGERILEGIELGANYRLPLFGKWKMSVGSNHTQMLTYEVEPFPGYGLEDRLGWPGNPRWKNNVYLGLYDLRNSVRFVARTIDGQFKNITDPGCCGELPVYTEYDVNYTYTGSWGGAFEFGVKNIANTTPPIDEYVYGANGFLNTELYNPLGRFYYFGYSQSF